MSDSVNIAAAKAKLSHLVDRAASGEEIVIARSGKPVARLVALADPPKRPFGIAKHWKVPPDEVFAPMSEEELRWAEGYYQKDNGLYYTKRDLARLRKQGLLGPPPKAKKAKRTRKR